MLRRMACATYQNTPALQYAEHLNPFFHSMAEVATQFYLLENDARYAVLVFSLCEVWLCLAVSAYSIFMTYLYQ